MPVSVAGFANRAGFVLDLEREVTVLAGSPREGADAVRLLAAVGFQALAICTAACPPGAPLETFRVHARDRARRAGAAGGRRPRARRAGETVPGALCIPYRELAGADLSALDPERPVATVCNSGVRAAVAASLLARRGFRDVRPVLEGGMPAYLAGAATPAAR